ncbi:hypothetical protein GCM10009422_11980 [Brevundimonas kwangchunensis]|uniref:Endonuclease GajA/Old nuclease/RecF-like AAA domain-containing protein n=2 Tax=Brevundimonas kwangchunensis TaxID=322163 RepID=A0ABN1GSJ4_9CAUL
MNGQELLFNRSERRGKATPEWFRRILYSADATGEDSVYNLTSDDRSMIERDINNTIKDRKDALLRHVLSYDDVSARKIEIGLDSDCFPKSIQSVYMAEARHGLFAWGEEESDPDLKVGLKSDPESNSILESVFYNFFLSGVLSGGLQPSSDRGAIYVPAARTGLMLAFRSLVSGLIDKLGISGGATASAEFPLPTIRFLQALNDAPRTSEPKFSKIAQAVEKEVLNGTIKSGSGVNRQFSYVTSSDGKALPLHVSSSMVTELAPFMILLRSGQLRSGVIFEEPEAHLHLSAQRSVARAIARLVNAGVPVVLTTHSDTFLQQMNISMQLHDHPRKTALCKAFGYAKDEVLDPAMARAYEFASEEDGTVVKELGKSSGGFVVPSLNQPLESLSSEVVAMDSR